jgi:nuclear pore complex protein Nup155
MSAHAAGAEGAGYGGGVSGGAAAAAHAARSLREAVSTRRLTGRAASSVGSMGEVPPPPAVLRDLDPPFPAAAARRGAAGGAYGQTPAPRLRGGELATQHVAPRRKFVIVTNAGVVLVEKARPLDALRELLLDDVHEHIARFFAAYGQAEAATMCLALALGAGAPGPRRPLTLCSHPRTRRPSRASPAHGGWWAPAPRRAARSSRRARPRRPRWPPPPSARASRWRTLA